MKITISQALRLSGMFPTIDSIKKVIKRGEIYLNARPIKKDRFTFNPNGTQLFYKGKPLRLFPFRYFILNKPKGFTCQRNEEPFVVNLLDLTERERNTISPVGRLDKETRGLLILTNDGSFTDKIINKKVSKTYIVETKFKIKNIEKLEKGVIIDVDGRKYKTLPAKVELRKENRLMITIEEGKKRQIRLMIKAIGNEVADLRRIRIGNLDIDNLGIEEGDYKEFTREELSKLIYSAPSL